MSHVLLTQKIFFPFSPSLSFLTTFRNCILEGDNNRVIANTAVRPE